MTRDELLSYIHNFSVHIAAAYRPIDVWETVVKESKRYPKSISCSIHFFSAVNAICASSTIIEAYKLLYNNEQHSINRFLNICDNYDKQLHQITELIRKEIKAHKIQLDGLSLIRKKIMAHTDDGYFSFDEMERALDECGFSLVDIKNAVAICERACNLILVELREKPLNCHDFRIGDLNLLLDLANQQLQKNLLS